MSLEMYLLLRIVTWVFCFFLASMYVPKCLCVSSSNSMSWTVWIDPFLEKSPQQVGWCEVWRHKWPRLLPTARSPKNSCSKAGIAFAVWAVFLSCRYRQSLSVFFFSKEMNWFRKFCTLIIFSLLVSWNFVTGRCIVSFDTSIPGYMHC
jgi:hypothetical protein